MTGIGRFRDDAAREAYVHAYGDAETLWPLPVETLDVPTSFGATHVRRSGGGAGVPLVLLHGLNGSSLSWHFAVSDFAADREVVALDTLGTAGRSVQSAPFTDDADLARWFDEVLAALGLDRVHLLGESNGAWHATLVALNGPQRLASLTLVEPNGFVTRPGLGALLKFVTLSARPTEAGWQRMNAWLTPGVTLSDREAALARAALRFRPGIGWARVLPDDELARLATPTFAVFGEQSVLSRPEDSVRRLAQLQADVETLVVPGGGHAVHAQLPRIVRPAILDFLARHDRVGSGAAD